MNPQVDVSGEVVDISFGGFIIGMNAEQALELAGDLVEAYRTIKGLPQPA